MIGASCWYEFDSSSGVNDDGIDVIEICSIARRSMLNSNKPVNFVEK